MRILYRTFLVRLAWVSAGRTVVIQAEVPVRCGAANWQETGWVTDGKAADHVAELAPEPAVGGRNPHHRAAHSGGLFGLALSALGIVFGDIGTSPLYAVQTVFSIDNHAVSPTPGDVYGVVSLIFWSVTLIVTVKTVDAPTRWPSLSNPPWILLYPQVRFSLAIGSISSVMTPSTGGRPSRCG